MREEASQDRLQFSSAGKRKKVLSSIGLGQLGERSGVGRKGKRKNQSGSRQVKWETSTRKYRRAVGNVGGELSEPEIKI